MYLYRGFYNLGIMSLGPAASWFASAILIIAALLLGLIFARILTDETFRYLYINKNRSDCSNKQMDYKKVLKTS